MNMRSKLSYILLFLLGGMLVFSCKKITNPDPGPPVIAYKSFTIISETEAYMQFTFSDPDGDIGLRDSDTSGAFAFGSEYYNDFHMRFQLKNNQGNYIDSVWTDPFTGAKDSAVFYYRIPYVDNKSKDKSLKGEIIVRMAGFRPASIYKDFRYTFFIYDRAHHKSNVVTTPGYSHP